MLPKVPGEPERREISGIDLDRNESETQQITLEEIFREIQPQLLLFHEEIEKSGVNNQQDLSLYLSSRQLYLSKLPIIDEHFFKTALISVDVETEKSFCLVETDKIVGRPFAKEYEDGWSHEYESRKGRIVEIATNLLRSVQEQNDELIKRELEHVFHPNKPSERIRVLALDGLSGPIYLVEDGTHRVAAAKLLGLKQIPCEVTRIKYPLTQWTYDEEVARFWQKLINLGLLKGKIDSSIPENGKTRYTITVEWELLPWIRVFDGWYFVTINQLYEELYPKSLDGLAMPRDALLNSVAYNHFMAGPEKWQEWQQKLRQTYR